MNRPRCPEIAGQTHRWGAGADLAGAGAERRPGATRVCERCGALGVECEACEGEGGAGEAGVCFAPCPACDGEGVVALPPRGSA